MKKDFFLTFPLKVFFFHDLSLKNKDFPRECVTKRVMNIMIYGVRDSAQKAVEGVWRQHW